MHTPTLRLVSLHPSLSVTLSFARVPEIHETFTWKVFFARVSTAKDVIETVAEELGLAKTLPVPGAGTLEYVLEEVFSDGKFGPRLCFLVLTSSWFRPRRDPALAFGWFLRYFGGSTEGTTPKHPCLSSLCTGRVV